LPNSTLAGVAGLPSITGGMSGIGRKMSLLFLIRASEAITMLGKRKKIKKIKEKCLNKIFMVFLPKNIFF
jgi:short-subunit dehydrogenase involved in D-alanine esterification of teichoic acids